MKLWERAAAALKDKGSICFAKVGRKKGHRYPDLEVAIIRATSHDESAVDYTNAQRVFAWIHTSPSFVKPVLYVLSRRMEKTRNWVVALKGLMLVHGVFCSRTANLEKIGRLPFDLSNFHDNFSKSSKSLGFSSLIRAYYAFLDERSSCFARDLEEKEKDLGEKSIEKILVGLQKAQVLLDLLLQIKPCADGMNVRLVLEAMDCVVIEIFDMYSSICHGIARVLVGISNSSHGEALMALRVLRKATNQSSRLSEYFNVCRELGVLNATELPTVEQIPEEDIMDLERIINGVSWNMVFAEYANQNNPKEIQEEDEEEEEAKEEPKAKSCLNLRGSGTIITENWEIFNDEIEILDGNDCKEEKNNALAEIHSDPFVNSMLIPAPMYLHSENFERPNGSLQFQFQNSPFFSSNSIARPAPTVENHINPVYSL